MSLEKFIFHPNRNKLDRQINFRGRNQMLYDFGLLPEDFDDEIKVWRKIWQIEKEFQLILIAEEFEKSLILLRDLVCGDIYDFTFLKLNSLNKEHEGKISSKVS